MKIKKEIQRTVIETVDYICNKCGNSCNLNDDSDPQFGGLIDENIIGQFFSKAITDGDVYNFSLCENCLVDLMKTFKISAFVENINDDIGLPTD